MRIVIRVLKILILLIVLGVAGILIFLFGFLPKSEPPATITVEQTPERLVRGEYLSRHVVICVHCHSDRNFRYFGTPSIRGTEGRGNAMFPQPEKGLGMLYAPNITPFALGKWTDGEVIRAVTAGVTKDGAPLFPIMPYDVYANLKEEDLFSIITFVRTLNPIQYETPKSKLEFPLNLIVRTIPHPPKPDPEAKDNPGHYLASIAGCIFCHTPVDNRSQPIPGMTLAGGHRFGSALSANLTPDPVTGIGKWTKQDFIAAFQKWQDPALQHVEMPDERNSPMPWIEFSGMKTEDLGAIFDYLRSVPPIVHRVEKFPRASS